MLEIGKERTTGFPIITAIERKLHQGKKWGERREIGRRSFKGKERERRCRERASSMGKDRQRKFNFETSVYRKVVYSFLESQKYFSVEGKETEIK